MAIERTMRPENLFDLRFLQSGELSPDGTKAVYSVSRVDAEMDKEFENLWLLQAHDEWLL